MAIYGAAAARQLDVDADALKARLRAVFGQMLEGLVTVPDPESGRRH
ncbi:MAG: hypothetical protein ACXW2C_00055 [Acidimicrobiia bacterium]